VRRTDPSDLIPAFCSDPAILEDARDRGTLLHSTGWIAGYARSNPFNPTISIEQDVT